MSMTSKPQCADDEIDNLTIMWTASDKSAQKKFVKNTTSGEIEKVNFDAGFRFSVELPIPLRDIDDLHAALDFLEGQPRAFIIRGEPVGNVEPQSEVRRLGSDSGGTFEGTFRTPTNGRRWILVDIDKLKLPRELTLTPKTITKVLAWVRGQLPPELQDVRCHWQLSSSAGVFDKKHVSIHFWFWLINPIPDADLKKWAAAFNIQSPRLKIDQALFQHIQPHYTASPQFVGMADPFPVRSGLVKGSSGSANIVVPKIAPAPSPKTKLPVSSGPIQTTAGFENIVASIGDHPGGAGFRLPLLRASASYVSSNGADGTDPEALYEMLKSAVLAADASAHSPDEVAERSSRETIMPMITSAITKYGYQKSISSPHVKKGIAPITPLNGTQLSPAQLAQHVQSFFNF